MRSKIIAQLFLTELLITSCLFAGNLEQETNENPPNFIVIFTDDQGYGDLGCYGSPNIRTPNIDRMASEGMRFTSFYAAYACATSRAQLMTGCYFPRAGIGRNPRPSSSFGMHPNEITIAEILKKRGYATKCIGKWHLGDAPEFLPTRQGFDSFFGLPFSNDMWRYHPQMPPKETDDDLMRAIRKRAAYIGLSGRYYPPGGGFPNDLPLMVDEKVVELNPDQKQLTTRYTKAALDFIDQNKERPFFLYLAHNMPHVPLFASPKFEGKSFRGLYGDVVMEIDWSVGKILKHLQKHGIDDNTMVIFTSDNGPWLSYGIDGGSAGPLRAGKGSVYEGGVRVPAIFWWPGKIPPGQNTSVIAGTLDLLPTFASLAGGEVPTDRVIDGRDIWPLLCGNSTNSPRDFFHYMGRSNEGKANYKGIRDERWKLLVSINRDGSVVPRELYDLGADVSERFNRLDQHPKIVARLKMAAQGFYDKLLQNIRPTGHCEPDINER
jgi:arylsulfatase A-like enzyme